MCVCSVRLHPIRQFATDVLGAVTQCNFPMLSVRLGHATEDEVMEGAYRLWLIDAPMLRDSERIDPAILSLRDD